MRTVHFRACNLCEAMCGVRIEVNDGSVVSIRGDEHDPFSRGHLCPKATALKDLHEDPDRLRTPMRRDGTRWQPVSWDEAFDEVAQRLHAVQRAHGDDAVAVYLGNPNVHNTGSMIFGPQFIRALHTRSRYSATSVDQLPHMLAAYWMLGHQLLLPVPDVDRTDHFLILGANPLASNGSLMTAPGIRHRLDAIRARGGKVIVIDPRRTETAARADEHHFIRPGTDALLLLAMLHEVMKGPVRHSAVLELATGLDVIRTLVSAYSPERVSAATGLSAETIRRLSHDFSSARSAVAYGRIGTSVQPFGTVCAWLITVLNVVTGNFDRPGGAMFPRPAFDPRALPKAFATGAGSHGRWRSRVRKLPETGGELPVATLAEDMLTPGKGQLKALVTIAGNPVLSTPNGRQLERALPGLDFMVAIDPYLNETTRFANVILPPPSALERGHFDIAFHLLAVRDTVRYGPPVFEKPTDARHDWQILSALGARLDALRSGSVSKRLTWAALNRLGPEGVLDLGLRLGARGGLGGLTLRKVSAHVHGLDLGPLEPVLPAALRTRSKTIELAPAALVKDLARLEQTLLTPTPGGLTLINRRHQRDCNSWLHNVPKLVSGAARCTLMMHPADADEHGLNAGDQVTITSRVGEVSAPLELTDQVMRGVVSLPHGYGHGREGARLRVANAHAGVSVNDLSDDGRIDELSGNAALSGVPVRVTRG